MSTSLGVWLAAISTLAVYSYLWKPNAAFTAAEHIFVAITGAHALVNAFSNVREMAFTPLSQGKLIWIVPIVLGFLLYARFWKRTASLARLPICFLIGVGAAVSLIGQIDASLIKQLKSTILPLTSINNIVLVVGTSLSVSFFFFTARASRGVLKSAGMGGRYVLMVAFGAVYGNTIMGRMSLIIGRFGFLLKDWLGVIE